MNFTTTKKNILNDLQTLSKVIPLRSTLPILSCVYLNKNEDGFLYLKASDLEQTVIINTKIKPSGEKAIAIPLSKILEIVSALPEEMEINFSLKENEEINISSGAGNYKISGKNPEEYPETPKIKTKEEIKLRGDDLLDLINKTTYATSRDDLKPALSGVYINFNKGSLTAVGTDGHRLVKYTKKTKTQDTVGALVIPVKFLNLIKNDKIKEKEIILKISDNHIQTIAGNKTILSRIIKESFPDFNSVIPKELENTAATIETTHLINSLKRILIFSNKTTKQVIINFNKDEIILCAEDKETKSSAKERIECKYKGKEVESGYNAQYLKEVIQYLETEKINIFISNSLTAAVIKPNHNTNENTEVVALLMPLRTNS